MIPKYISLKIHGELKLVKEFPILKRNTEVHFPFIKNQLPFYMCQGSMMLRAYGG